MNHNGTVLIETERLILRRFDIADADAAFTNWMGDGKVTEFLRWQPHESVEVTARVIDNWIQGYENNNYYQWAIVLKQTDKPIGSISVVEQEEKTEKLHVGYCIGSRWWNSGYTSEAFAAIIAYLFKTVKANRIESQHDPENIASGKVMKKCGLKYEGTLKQYDWSNKGIVDACMYGITAKDYFSKKEEVK